MVSFVMDLVAYKVNGIAEEIRWIGITESNFSWVIRRLTYIVLGLQMSGVALGGSDK